MITIYNKAIEVILNALERYVDAALAKAHFDRTFRGVILSVNAGIYTVRIGKETYNIKSADTYAVGDTVYVLFVQNDPKHKIIIGKVV